MAKAKETKTDKVRSMLARPQGARLEAICKATGWQSRSARAVLSGLRKAGFTVERQPAGDGKGGGATYRVTGAPESVE